MSSSTARYWNRYLAIVVGVTGYALLFAVPFIQALFPDSVGKLVGLLIMLCLYVYAVRVIWKNRREVSAGLKAKAASGNATLSGALLRVLARIWHFLCIAYLTVLFVVSQTDQQEALSFMAQATLQSLIAIALGLLVATPLSSFAARPIQLRSDLRSAFPHLETRLNSYVPAALRAARLLIGVTVALIVLDAWQAFDLIAWVRSDSGYATIAMIVHVAIILFIAALIWIVIASLIENRLSTPGKATEREKTLLMLFRSAAAVVIATMTVLIVLSQIGIDIGPLIAGAGVVGLAVGFGAQKLVQDVITGVFIQLENGMNQNDVVEVGGLFGTVEKITIRSVFLRTLDGGYHVIPFSTIDRVTNHMRDYGYHYGEYNIAHRESVDDAIAQLRLAFQAMMQDAQVAALVLEDISIPGVTALNERGFSVRVLIKTLPGSQWEVQRAFNGQVKRHFDAAGIEIPYPQAVVHFGRDKSGYAAPVDVKYVDTLKQVSGKTPAPGQTMQPGLQASN